MALLVQKYGGTSVGTVEKIQNIADKLIAHREQGHDLVVVVSAMSGETNRMVAMAQAMMERPTPREMDVLLSTGEQVTISLLCMALHARGQAAVSYTGSQVRITTDDAHTKARIKDIDDAKMRADLSAGSIVVVAGFQGADEHGNITTLGRGGSDTTGVALAAALKADECQIYTDVDGVYTTDPRVEPNARRMARISFEEMLELASLGSKILQIRSVEFAGKYKVPLRVLSTFQDGPGTLITLEDDNVEAPLISGIAFNKDEAQITMRGVPDNPGVAHQVLSAVAAANIEVDMIIQNLGAGDATDFTFTVHRNDFEQAMEIMKETQTRLGAKELAGDLSVVKVSLVGVGMKSHAGVASRMFEILANEGINIRLISTSEIKISVLVDEKYLELAVRALHAGFELEKS